MFYETGGVHSITDIGTKNGISKSEFKFWASVLHSLLYKIFQKGINLSLVTPAMS